MVDNCATRRHPELQNWLVCNPRFVLHFTPTNEFWLNLVERFVRDITKKHIRRENLTRVAELEPVVRRYLANHHIDPKPFIRTASAQDIWRK